MKCERLPKHQRNQSLESLLTEVNDSLGIVEKEEVKKYKNTKYPVVLIVGSARSGSTLLMQWLADTGSFAYPTNLMSRFYGAPYIGAKIQLILTKYDFNNEIFDFNEIVHFKSDLGKTKGALAPNEFWYFWRRFFKFNEIQKLDSSALKQINKSLFISEIAAMEDVFQKPFAMKGLIANWHIPYLAEILEKVIFIYIKRHPLYQAQSLLEARKNYYGDINDWYSFKPPEYDFLKDQNPYEQIMGQIYYTNKAIEYGLAQIDQSRYLYVDYEKFCQAPDEVYRLLFRKMNQQGYNDYSTYCGLQRFDIANKIRLPNEEVEKLITAYKKITNEEIES
jgi:hypothetical protein